MYFSNNKDYKAFLTKKFSRIHPLLTPNQNKILQMYQTEILTDYAIRNTFYWNIGTAFFRQANCRHCLVISRMTKKLLSPVCSAKKRLNYS